MNYTLAKKLAEFEAADFVGQSTAKCPTDKTCLIVVVYKEDTGEVISGAEVEVSGLSQPKKGQTSQAFLAKDTDRNGLAKFTPWDPGNYTIDVSLPQQDEYEKPDRVHQIVARGTCPVCCVPVKPLPKLLVKVVLREDHSRVFDGALVKVASGPQQHGDRPTVKSGIADFGLTKSGKYAVQLISLKETDREDFVAPKARVEEVLNSGDVSKTVLIEVEQIKWGITEITLSCAGKSSTSYQDPHHDPIPGGDVSRFYFAPLEDSVKVAWKLKNKDHATTLKLELYRACDSGKLSPNATPIWSRTLNSGAAQAEQLDHLWDGSFPESEWLNFPDHLVTVEHSPYKLKATAGTNREDDLEVRWTYFAVLIEKIELTWGGKALIPGGARGDIDALYSARTLADEQTISDALGVQKRADDTLDPADNYEVKLPCNQFTSWVYDMEDANVQRKTTLWLNHQKQWGDGPRIPLVARVYVAKAAGGGVHGAPSAKALGGTKFLWDWESQDEIAGLGTAGHDAKVTAFLTDSLDYLRNDPEGPPGSSNCHEDHGGKRGATKKVFAPLAAVSAGSTACATRKWATFEQAIISGPHAGCVGVLFQPSRIALDTYIVSVYASPDVCSGGPLALDTADAASKLRTDHPSLPRAESGTFEMLREIRIRYVRKSAAVTTAILASMGQEYRRAGMVIDWGTSGDRATDEATLATNFQNWFTQSLQTPDAKGRGSLEPNRAWFETNDQLRAGTGADTAFGFIVESWERIARRILIDSIREYVQKDRTFNSTRKNYNAWLNLPGNTIANDHQYLFPFYNGLSRAKKLKVDTIFEGRRRAAGLPEKAMYEGNMESAGVHAARMIAECLLVQIAEHGMVIFHVETPVAFRQIDGSILVPDSQTGGLSPSTSSKWQGRGSVNLVFLPQIPTTDPTAAYHVPVTGVITHEAGHNLYLCHAPAEAYDQGGPEKAAPGLQEYAHDDDDLRCLMNYDQRSDHLCGYCNLKLRGWGTVQKGDLSQAGPIDGGLVKLWNDAALNRKP